MACWARSMEASIAAILVRSLLASSKLAGMAFASYWGSYFARISLQEANSASSIGSVTSGRLLGSNFSWFSLLWAVSSWVFSPAICSSSLGISSFSWSMASRSCWVRLCFWVFSWALPESSWLWALSSSARPSLILVSFSSSCFLASARRSLTLTSSLSFTSSILSWSSVICTDFLTRPVVETLATPSTRSSWGTIVSST